MKVKTIFLGSNWESLEIIKSLIKTDLFEIVSIVTQPDKPVGRKQILTPTKVKKFGLENNIPVEITEKKEERYRTILEKYHPELVVCIAFGEIVPEFFLKYPKYKAINVHFSILPKYRGAVPIQMVILNGEKETGISIVQMVSKLDAGPILRIIKEKILPDDTNLSLRERLVSITKKVLPSTLEDWIKGRIETKIQNEDEASYCYKENISKEKAEIDFRNMDAEYIGRATRAFIPWPVAWTLINKKRIKIFKTRIDNLSPLKLGEIKTEEKRLVIGTKKGNIEILELQLEGKKIMSASEYILGLNTSTP